MVHSRICNYCRNLAEEEKRLTFAPMKEMPCFISKLIHALAQCEDVDETTIVSLSRWLMNSPKTAILLTAFAELGYCNSEIVLTEYERLSRYTGGA